LTTTTDADDNGDDVDIGCSRTTTM